MAQVETAWAGWFEPTPDSVATVRHIVEAHLEHVSPACREAAVLVASELATNVVCHARTPYTLRLIMGGPTVTIEVTDAGPGAPQLFPATSTVSDGFGLRLVSAVSTAWGVEPQPEAKTVWAELAVDA